MDVCPIGKYCVFSDKTLSTGARFAPANNNLVIATIALYGSQIYINHSKGVKISAYEIE